MEALFFFTLISSFSYINYGKEYVFLINLVLFKNVIDHIFVDLFPPSRQRRGVDPPVQIRRVEEAQRKGCRKTSVFLWRETGMSGHFVGHIKGDKYRFELQFLKWDFS